MASDYNKQLQQIFAPTMKAAGYKKTGSTWHRQSGEVIQVFNIQGSQYGPTFYLNMGIHFCAIEDKRKPCVYDCHVTDHVQTMPRQYLYDLLDFKIDIPIQERAEKLIAVIHTIAFPWLERYSSPENIRADYRSHEHLSLQIQKAASDYLGFDPHA